MLVSSANNMGVALSIIAFGKSLIYKRNNCVLVIKEITLKMAR
jgi:hypothetical protein